MAKLRFIQGILTEGGFIRYYVASQIDLGRAFHTACTIENTLHEVTKDGYN